jgi:TRAP-type transport system small permease protein
MKASLYVDRFCRAGSVGFFTGMFVLMLFQVVARYIFQNVPVWTEELARHCMVWGGLLGATVAFRADHDPRLVPIPRDGPRWRVVSAFYVRAAAAVIFLAPVLYYSDRFLMRTWHRSTEALGIPTMWVTLAVPLCVAVIFFHLLCRMVSGELFHQQDPTEK